MTVVINEAAINNFFERRATGGGKFGREGSANALADRMLRKAKANASGTVVKERSGDLRKSLEKIVRIDARTGRTEIGVGSTIEYSKYLEDGASAPSVPIRPLRGRALSSKGPRTKGRNPNPLKHPVRAVYKHTGVKATHFLRKAVHDVAYRGL